MDYVGRNGTPQSLNLHSMWVLATLSRGQKLLVRLPKVE